MWLHHRYWSSDFKRNCWIKSCTGMKELVCKLLLTAHTPKSGYKMHFSENQTKETGRNRQSPSPLTNPNSQFSWGLWKRAGFWRLGSLLIWSYFSWFPFPSLASLSWPVLTYYINNIVTKRHYSGITKYAFSGTSCFKSLKSDLCWTIPDKATCKTQACDSGPGWPYR